MFCSFQIQPLRDLLIYLTPICNKYVIYHCALKDTVTFFSPFCSFVIILNFYQNLK